MSNQSRPIDLPKIILGSWSFSDDKWWGRQASELSLKTMETALINGVYAIDTAPCYGRGHAEKLIGQFINNHARESLFIATKLGLSWRENSPAIFHDLSPKRMLEEIDESRKRLNTDYLDLYQIHWPDKNIPIAKSAEIMLKFYNKGIIRHIGVSNYSTSQIAEFIRFCPLHCLQPQYSLFFREIEQTIIPFCVKHNIAIITYAPLYSGLLTGKFHLGQKTIPTDINRKNKKIHFSEPLFSIDKRALLALNTIAESYDITLTQLAISWNFSQEGITSSIVGARTPKQMEENANALTIKIKKTDLDTIRDILTDRQTAITKDC